MSFTKLDSSILASTVWVGTSPETKVVWIAMLALRNQHHVVEASVPGLAQMAGVPVPAVEKALKLFLAPDPYSRTKDFEGRRIEAVEGGWRLLNGEKYRAKGRSTERTEYFREYRRRERAKERLVEAEQPAVNECAPPFTPVHNRSHLSTKPTEKKAKLDPLAVPIPAELQSAAFIEEWQTFIEFRQRLGKPFKTEEGPKGSLRLLVPLGPARAVRALQLTRQNEWQGVKYGIAELEEQERKAATKGVAPATPAAARRRAAQELELERQKVKQRAFGNKALTAEQRDSIVDAAERATCLEDLERILWPT